MVRMNNAMNSVIFIDAFSKKGILNQSRLLSKLPYSIWWCFYLGSKQTQLEHTRNF